MYLVMPNVEKTLAWTFWVKIPFSVKLLCYLSLRASTNYGEEDLVNSSHSYFDVRLNNTTTQNNF